MERTGLSSSSVAPSISKCELRWSAARMGHGGEGDGIEEVKVGHGQRTGS